jgi:hypothetical protein
MANRTANTPPTAGNKKLFQTPESATPRRANDPPKQTPGKTKGKRTPSDMPTSDEKIVKMYKNTIATSEPTGTKRGSKNVNAKKPAVPANVEPA